MVKLRPAQEQVLAYRRGTMGISAVPGSGKTFTLSLLAAELLTRRVINEDQEILIVTLVNSAVDNFRQRIGSFVREKNLLPNVGYRVRTLHGLAHDIVRERPSLVGLSDDFQIIDDQEALRIRLRATDAWLKAHPGAIIDNILAPEVIENASKADWIRRDKWPDLARQVAGDLIGRAKDVRLTPEDLASRLDQGPPLPLLGMCLDVYREYERALSFRGAVDFADLVRYAILALERDEEFLARLQDRWPYILEDESQDSSQLQEEVLRLLTGDWGNWVRVGDPNQAIYETFTTASPQHLLDFLEEAESRRQLPNSGRSTQSIIDLADRLIQWTRQEHDVPELRSALSLPLIEAAPPGDPQPNPADGLSRIEFVNQPLTGAEEIGWVVSHIASWLPTHPDQTMAVLVPTNDLGAKVAARLAESNLVCVELLRTTSATRKTAGALTHLMEHLANPAVPKHLATAYKVWRRGDQGDEEAAPVVARCTKLIGQLAHVEDFLWPRPGHEWQEAFGFADGDEEAATSLGEFRQQMQRWEQAASLPVDQLLLTLAQDLFEEPAELALAHKLASMLSRTGASRPDWRLPEFRDELVRIALNKRTFLGFSEDTSFDPDQQKGKVVVATYHKAKGLEWDRVYLMGANNYNFPSAHPGDPYHSDKWFIRDRLDLTAEVLAQLDAVLSDDMYAWYEEGRASEAAKLDGAAEALRTFYVGITRARKELFVTYNTGFKGTEQPAVPFLVLMTYLESKRNAPSS